MPLKLTRARTAIARTLMPDTFRISDPGARTQSDTGGWDEAAPTTRETPGGLIVRSREADAELLRQGLQVASRGRYAIRLPLDVVVGAQSAIQHVASGRVFEVVDQPPIHGLSLAQYIGVEEVVNPGAAA